MQIAFPFGLDRDGRVARADDDAHIRQLIEQVLFTAPGERVNRPDFGCGLTGMVFEAMSSEMLGVTQSLVRGALLRWLGDLIAVEALAVEPDGGRLTITVAYAVLATRQRRVDSFVR